MPQGKHARPDMRPSHVGQARQNRSRIACWAAYGRTCSTQDAGEAKRAMWDKARLSSLGKTCGGKAEALRQARQERQNEAGN